MLFCYGMAEQHSFDFSQRLCSCGKTARTGSTRCNHCGRGKAKPRGPFICQNPLCGKEFYKTSRPSGGGQRCDQYCSRACYFHGRSYAGFRSDQIFLADALITHVHKADKAKRTKDRRAWLKTPEGRKWYNANQLAYLRKYKGQALETTECTLCGESFLQDRIGRKHCTECRTTDRIRRVWHESVNPYVVFERDSWTCQHCKKPTPESHRGTLKDSAPELDHILPVAFNGAHSYFNTQCLCRKCNSKKGEHSESEPKLLDVTDLAPYKTGKHPPLVGDRKEQLCACGCGESFIPSHSNLTGCKHGHWHRSEEGQRTQCGNLGRARQGGYSDARRPSKSFTAEQVAAYLRKPLEQPEPKSTDSYNTDLTAQEALYQSVTSQLTSVLAMQQARPVTCCVDPMLSTPLSSQHVARTAPVLVSI